jgi:hypothetical protein
MQENAGMCYQKLVDSFGLVPLALTVNGGTR